MNLFAFNRRDGRAATGAVANGRGVRTALCVGVSALALLTAASTLTGCGSDSGSLAVGPGTAGAPSRKPGRVVFRVTWPARESTRLIPDASNSIKIVITKAGVEVDSVVLARPEGDGPAEWTSKTLEPGDDYLASATAYPNADGTGVAQATKSTATVFSIVDGEDTRIPLTMDSTITTLQITGAQSFPLRTGEGLKLTLIARDAAGNIVLTSPAKVAWSVENESQGGLAAVSEDDATPASDADVTVIGTVTEGAPQSFVVRATDAGESNLSATVTLRVSPVGLSELSIWPKFRFDSFNTGLAPATGLTNADGTDVLFRTDGPITYSSTAVAQDGTVYIGTADRNARSGKLYAIRPDGSQKWPAVSTSGAIEGSPLIARDGTVYVGSADGNLYAIENDGTVRFTFAADGEIFGSPAIDSNGTLYFGTTFGGRSLYAIDSLTGKLKWRFQGATDGIESSPAVVEQGSDITVYAASLDGVVYAVDGATGAKKADSSAARANDAFIASSPVLNLAGTVLYIGSVDGRLYAFNTSDLSLLWSFDAQAPIYATPALDQDETAIYVTTFDLSSGFQESKLWAVNPATGTVVERVVVDPDTLNPVNLWANGLRIGGADGLMTSSPTVDVDGKVYFAAYNDTIYAVDPNAPAPTAKPTDLIAWSYTVDDDGDGEDDEDFDSSPVFGADGLIYIGNLNGNVYRVAPGVGNAPSRSAKAGGVKKAPRRAARTSYQFPNFRRR